MSITERMGQVGIWTGVFDAHPAGAVSDAAAELEEMGFRGLWIPETVGRDPFVLASVLLGATSSLNVATGIANIWARDELTMNAVRTSLNEAFAGRFLLGLGVSHHTLVGWVRKHDYSKPYTRMVEYLERMGKAMYRGPRPEEDPLVVLAALGPKMLELAASETAGAHPYLVPPEHTEIARAAMGADAWLAPEQMVLFETDADRAREIARKHLEVYLGLPNYAGNLRRLGYDQADIEGASDEVVDAIVAWGDDDAVKARIDAHLAAGADHVCAQVLTDDTAVPLDGWRRVAALYAS